MLPVVPLISSNVSSENLLLPGMVYSVVKSGKRVLKISICDQFNRIGLVNHRKFFEISQRGVSQKYLTYDGFAFIGAIVFASYL